MKFITLDRTTIGDARGSVDTLDARHVTHRPADECAVGRSSKSVVPAVATTAIGTSPSATHCSS
ncbi:hypothetical protein, partial [Streptomyces sp900116325]|uniref:hypothetical protein n=1 Tax=Streptomyces sp. 900116325 TaxID=3154295 RepID=UPI0033314776